MKQLAPACCACSTYIIHVSPTCAALLAASGCGLLHCCQAHVPPPPLSSTTPASAGPTNRNSPLPFPSTPACAEMNVAYAWHEGIADHIIPCLVWFASNGTLNLQVRAAVHAAGR